MANYICNLFTYSRYEYNLNNVLCEQVPFKFEISHELDLYLELNKPMTEISIYNDYDPNKILIYAHGSKPTCYVEGCEILEENNP